MPINENNLFKFFPDALENGTLDIYMMNIPNPISIPIVNGEPLCPRLNFGRNEVSITHIILYGEGGRELGLWDWRDKKGSIYKEVELGIDYG